MIALSEDVLLILSGSERQLHLYPYGFRGGLEVVCAGGSKKGADA